MQVSSLQATAPRQFGVARRSRVVQPFGMARARLHNQKDAAVSFGSDIDAKERIRQAVNIVDLVGSYQSDIRRQGQNYACRCPWHEDRSPSLTINAARQSWKCWVCNIGGDIFSFVMRKENCGFREALEMLAERANIQLTNKPSAPITPGSPNDKKTLFECMAWAEKVFHECLLQADVAAPARKYLDDRGIARDMVAHFKVGFSPLEWTWLLDRARHTPYSPEVLEACGLCPRSQQSGKHFDMFRGRVLFPIRDPQSRTIAFGGRVLPDWADQLRGKYVNTAETRLFSKSDHLYALDMAKDTIAKTRNITVVEGYTDVVMAHQFGATDVVAVLGTALGPRHIQHLKRYADRITLVLDGDAAGQRRTNEVLEYFVAAQVDLRILTLPEELDPCEFFLERGLAAWQEMIGSAVDALEHKIRSVTRGIDLVRDSHAANKALEEVLATLAHAPSDPLVTQETARLREQQVITRLAREFRVAEPAVRERIKDLRKKAAGAIAPQTPSGPRSGEAAALIKASVRAASLDPRERELLELLCVHPELAPTALQELAADDFPSAAAREIFSVYRQLEEAGRDLEFPLVLGELEEHLKGLFVEIDDRAVRKEAKALQDAPARLRSAIDRLRSHEAEREHREKLAVLEEWRLGTDEEKLILNEIVQLKLRQMGIQP
jgi:DNA primase